MEDYLCQYAAAPNMEHLFVEGCNGGQAILHINCDGNLTPLNDGFNNQSSKALWWYQRERFQKLTISSTRCCPGLETTGTLLFCSSCIQVNTIVYLDYLHITIMPKNILWRVPTISGISSLMNKLEIVSPPNCFPICIEQKFMQFYFPIPMFTKEILEIAPRFQQE